MNGVPIVLFVCQHGSAKSVIAATMMQRVARERGLLLDCRSAGIDPDTHIPPRVIEGLNADGIDVSAVQPQAVTRAMVATARHVVSFGCDLTEWSSGRIQRWDDVPAVSDGYAAARDSIVAHVRGLANEMDKRDSAPD